MWALRVLKSHRMLTVSFCFHMHLEGATVLLFVWTRYDSYYNGWLHATHVCWSSFQITAKKLLETKTQLEILVVFNIGCLGSKGGMTEKLADFTLVVSTPNAKPPNSKIFWQFTNSLQLLTFGIVVAMHTKHIVVSYWCGKAPMDTHSSSSKNWGWTVTRRRHLSGSTIAMQASYTNPKSPMHTVSSLCFAFGQMRQQRKLIMPESRRTHTLVGTHLQHLSLALRKFYAVSKEYWRWG